jgi:nicotinamidase-related amidase
MGAPVSHLRSQVSTLQEEISMNATMPQTLLQMRGLELAPARLSDASVVIIDAQGEYRGGRMTLPGIDPALARIADLLARARSAGTPIFHVAQTGQQGTLFDPTTERGTILPQAAQIAGEPLIMKRLPNAFAGTELHERLQQAGRRKLILAGFMTHMCISASARAALDLDYQTTVIADATATRTLPAHGGGTPIPADAVHRVALAELADRFAAVVTSDRIAG